MPVAAGLIDVVAVSVFCSVEMECPTPGVRLQCLYGLEAHSTIETITENKETNVCTCRLKNMCDIFV